MKSHYNLQSHLLYFHSAKMNQHESDAKNVGMYVRIYTMPKYILLNYIIILPHFLLFQVRGTAMSKENLKTNSSKNINVYLRELQNNGRAPSSLISTRSCTSRKLAVEGWIMNMRSVRSRQHAGKTAAQNMPSNAVTSSNLSLAKANTSELFWPKV